MLKAGYLIFSFLHSCYESLILPEVNWCLRQHKRCWTHKDSNMNDSHGMVKRNMTSLCLIKMASVWRIWGFPGGSDSKEADRNVVGDPGSIPGFERSPAGENDHSSILGWRIPWTEEPGRLQSRGSQRFGHDWVTNTFAFHMEDMSNKVESKGSENSLW